MAKRVPDLSALQGAAGAVCVTAAVAWQFALPWGLLTFGVLLLLGAFFDARQVDDDGERVDA